MSLKSFVGTILGRSPTVDLLTFAGTSEGVRKAWLKRERAKQVESSKFDPKSQNVLKQLGETMGSMKGSRAQKIAKIVGVIGKEKGVQIVGDPSNPKQILIPTGEKGAAILGKLQSSLVRGATSKRSKGEIKDAMGTLRDAFAKIKSTGSIKKADAPSEKSPAETKGKSGGSTNDLGNTVSMLKSLPIGTKITIDSEQDKRLAGTWTNDKSGNWTNERGDRIPAKKLATFPGLREEAVGAKKTVEEVRSSDDVALRQDALSNSEVSRKSGGSV